MSAGATLALAPGLGAQRLELAQGCLVRFHREVALWLTQVAEGLEERLVPSLQDVQLGVRQVRVVDGVVLTILAPSEPVPVASGDKVT